MWCLKTHVMWLNFTCYNHKVEHNFYISKLSTTCNDEDSLLFPQNEYKAREGLVVVGNVGRWIICCLPRVRLLPNPAVSLCWRWAERWICNHRRWLGFLPDLLHNPISSKPPPLPTGAHRWPVQQFAQPKKKSETYSVHKIPPCKHI